MLDIILFIIILIMLYFLIKTKAGNKKSQIQEPLVTQGAAENSIQQPDTFEYSGRYQKKLLLTKNEWYEYRKLKQLAEKDNLQIFPKVRLLDLIEPRKGDPKYKTLFYKIQAKHVDFVVSDQNAYIKAIIELDDNSHNQADRKERDDFVDQILRDVGYTVVRTRGITEHTLSAACGQNTSQVASTCLDHSS